MTHRELNQLPHRTLADLQAIPHIKLRLINPPVFLRGSVTTVYDPVENDSEWTGCQRMPRTGDFYPRQSFSKSDYEVAKEAL